MQQISRVLGKVQDSLDQRIVLFFLKYRMFDIVTIELLLLLSISVQEVSFLQKLLGLDMLLLTLKFLYCFLFFAFHPLIVEIYLILMRSSLMQTL